MSLPLPEGVNDFVLTFKAFLDQVVNQVPEKPSPFLRYIQEHFAQENITFPILAEHFEKSEHPNVHLALTQLLAKDETPIQLMGVVVPPYTEASLKALMSKEATSRFTEGPVEYRNVALQDEQRLACVQSGLYLFHYGGEPFVVFIQGPAEESWRNSITIEVMAKEQSLVEQFLADLRKAARKLNVYRGHVVSLSMDSRHAIEVRFHKLLSLTQENIILPAGVLKRIERHTIGFAGHSEALLAAGRHLKRGLLLYGAPGTGKTLTAMYLANQMADRTVIIITGRAVGLLEYSCAMARLLQPATVILEDVDLVAEERTRQESGCTVLLFELLNQMDGLADDADILFVLTTNRADILEPALAARPGRIDQAIEIPLPDRECRERLIDLYGQGLTLQLQHKERFVAQTEGVSAAFIRELLRKAALFAADEQTPILVEDRHLDDALRELLFEGGELTRQLLGASRAQ